MNLRVWICWFYWGVPIPPFGTAWASLGVVGRRLCFIRRMRRRSLCSASVWSAGRSSVPWALSYSIVLFEFNEWWPPRPLELFQSNRINLNSFQHLSPFIRTDSPSSTSSIVTWNCTPFQKDQLTWITNSFKINIFIRMRSVGFFISS